MQVVDCALMTAAIQSVTTVLNCFVAYKCIYVLEMGVIGAAISINATYALNYLMLQGFILCCGICIQVPE